ncbi:hypothetical protein Gotri_005244 [Gossypium trilobum]|uniref:NAB domain-containing protein n=1 Tax=Gossypium trilobum TaxID=34281 RepID=A0A7J9EWC5_9ROSI|nr:hypothetical protein [Gossypium trilobum]
MMMLQKAASNAYSWWWVSHIRTKQSKWLEQNLQDMEEKVRSMLKIIDDDGDSFAKRAEIYFKKRPELVSIVEECYRSYQALAERYDHLSKDLQSANRTIATVFPEQVPYSLDDEQDPGSRVWFHKGKVNKALGSAVPSSGLNKDEALDEIDKLSKEISDMETERECLKRAYVEGYKKFCEVDNQVAEKQRRVSNLRVEFGLGSVTDDKHELPIEDVNVDSEKIKHVHLRFEALRNRFSDPQINQQKKHVPITNVDNKVHEVLTVEKEKHVSEVSWNETDEKLEVSSNNASRMMSELVVKIDELVQRVVNWETTFLSERDLEKRSKSDADEVPEEDKEAEKEGREIINSRMNLLEGELSKVKDLVDTVVHEMNGLKTHSAEPSCNVDHLSVKAEADSDVDVETEDHQIEQALKDKDVSAEGKNNVACETSNVFDAYSSKGPVSTEEDKAKKQYLSDMARSIPDAEINEIETDDEEVEQPNWRQLYLDGLDDREQVVVDKYSSVLENYEEVKKKLNEVDKNNRDGFFELAMQIKELKNAVASRDREVQSLHRKIGFLDENNHVYSIEDHEVNRESPSEQSTLTNSIEASPSEQGKDGSIRKEITVEVESTTHRSSKESSEKAGENNKRTIQSVIENKIRSSIDELLEENLVFWLRFSAAFNQIKKHQTSVNNLKAKLSTLRKRNHYEGRMEHMQSEIRPVYCQFQEIRTGLTLWLENNGVLTDEIESRYTSICKIQNEIASGDELMSVYQATKFKGEVTNMKHELTKVSNELKSGFEHVWQLKHEVEKQMNSLEKELGSLISSMSQPSKSRRSSMSRIPLRSFLLGIKLRNSKQSKGSSIVTSYKNLSKSSR